MIRNRVREFRELHGLTQQELAERANISLPIIIRLETVDGYAPRLDTVERLCRVFNNLPIERMVWFDFRAEASPPVGELEAVS